MWEHPSNTKVKKLKEKYKDLYPNVEILVNQWDPIGLIDGGAPKDEYDCISVQLIEFLIQGKKNNEIYEFIVHELDDHFGMGIDSIAEEYKEKFIQRHTKFSEQITNWYEQYKQEQ
ncbi:hypothetical protein [Cohnella sp. GCM10027633]|uniref:hypothetical protein n=1 Tax=unclassified Cohnella TaxID=2636738 RepID=UPI00362CBF32